VTKGEADTLIAAIRDLVEETPGKAPAKAEPVEPMVPVSMSGSPTLERIDAEPLNVTRTVVGTNVAGEARTAFTDAEIEKLYQAFKTRLVEEARIDPILLQILTTRPEIVVEIEPRIVTIDGTKLKGRIARLIAQGWLAETRATSAVRYELARTGPDPGGGGRLSDTLGELLNEGFLVRAGDGWVRAPGVKVTERQLAVNGG
jgi:hypothetical protein